MEEVVQSLSGSAAMTIQVALAAAEQVALRRAARLHAAARESQDSYRRVQAQYRAEADLHAARWAAASRQGPEWIDAYASAVAWRELDPRAAQAAERIENQLRSAGIEIPDTGMITAQNQEAIRGGYLDVADQARPVDNAVPDTAAQEAAQGEAARQQQWLQHRSAAEEWLRSTHPDEHSAYRMGLMGTDSARDSTRMIDELIDRWKTTVQQDAGSMTPAPGAPEAALAGESHPQDAGELVKGSRAATGRRRGATRGRRPRRATTRASDQERGR